MFKTFRRFNPFFIIEIYIRVLYTVRIVISNNTKYDVI